MSPTPPTRPHLPDRVTALSTQLVVAHATLRDQLEELTEHLDSGVTPDLRTHCLAFCSALSEHHTEEDDDTFVVLAQRVPGLAPVLTKLRTDHWVVSRILGQVERAVSRLGADDDATHLAATREHLSGLAAILETHFRYEERQISTALDDLERSAAAAGTDATHRGRIHVMTAAWTADELARIGDADELEIATRRPDGTLRRWTPIWVVLVGGQVYVRTWQRRDTGWFGRAVDAGAARVRVPGVEADVVVEDVGGDDPGLRTGVDDAYLDTYARYGDATVGRMVGDGAAASTLRLVPAPSS